MNDKEMKELNKRMIEKLPENRNKSEINEKKIRKQNELSKRKEQKDIFINQVKQSVLANKKD